MQRPLTGCGAVDERTCEGRFCDAPQNGEAMTSKNEMSESEALEYIRAELQVLQPILGELICVFWNALVEQWEREGCQGISPVDRQYALDELAKMATEWLQRRNTLR